MYKNQVLSLIEQANEVRKNAYAPYSNFLVGCAVRLFDGRVFLGVNIENASFPVGICAERAAMAQVVTAGLQKEVESLAVVTKTSPPGSLCGICRQFLYELLEKDVTIILANEKGETLTTNLLELLPRAFDKNALL